MVTLSTCTLVPTTLMQYVLPQVLADIGCTVVAPAGAAVKARAPAAAAAGRANRVRAVRNFTGLPLPLESRPDSPDQVNSHYRAPDAPTRGDYLIPLPLCVLFGLRSIYSL